MALFTDDFTDTNGQPWDAAKWTTDAGGGGGTEIIDIQSNQGRMRAGNTTNDWAAGKGITTGLVDSEILVYCDGTGSDGTSNQFLYVWLRSDGQLDNTYQGRPADGYAMRVSLWSGTTECRFIQRLTNSESNFSCTPSRTADSPICVDMGRRVERAGNVGRHIQRCFSGCVAVRYGCPTVDGVHMERHLYGGCPG